MTTHMEQAGLPLDEVRRVQRRALELEHFVAAVYGGWVREEGDDIGDVDIPDIGTVDVKSVPTPMARFVNGGDVDHRPVSLVVVASWRPKLVLGLVEPEQWELGLPDVPGRRPQRCWHVRRAEVFPPPSYMARPGCVLPEWYEMTEDDLLHGDWRDRDRRRVLRRTYHPEPFPWADPESVRRGTGLAGRRGHAPGKDNYKRKRPK